LPFKNGETQKPHAYCLEVCSPGIERELVRPEHFKKFEGHPVSVRLYHPIENKREYRGVLVGYQDGSVIIRTMDNQQKLFSKKSTSSVNVLEDWDDLTKGETDNEQREH
jgi:ribosome maturation factor RimP